MRASVHAEQRADALGVAEQLRRRPVWTTRPPSSTTTCCATRATTARFCSTSSTVASSRDALERGRDLGHEQRREPLRRLVDEQHRVVVQERPGDRDHLLLAARERAGLLRRRASRAPGRARRRARSGRCRSARRGAGSRRRSGRRRRRGPPARSRSRAGRSGASAAGVSSSPASVTLPRRGTSPIIARSVVVLPTPFRPSSAVTPPSGTSNETPWRTCDSPR